VLALRRRLAGCSRLMVESGASTGICFGISSSIEGAMGDVRAVAIDCGAGDIVVPLEEASIEVCSSTSMSLSVRTDVVPSTCVPPGGEA
jgi:hypothetical protein